MRCVAALLLSSIVLAACAAPAADTVDESEQHWDSAGGNPTHSTHSYFAEYAVRLIGAEQPEVRQYAASILEGVNLELHELPLTKDVAYEPLREEIGGTNWAAAHPELLWDKARASYAAGDKAQAYLYVGVILHYVQDMGVPAHAFHVIHQNRPWNWDNLEMLGFWELHGDLKAPLPEADDPKLADPVAYIDWSGARAREHFQTAFPGATYHRTFFPQAYDEMTDADWAFLRERETFCAHATAYALRSAAAGLAGPAR